MDLSKLTTSDKIIAGSGIVLFISSFLPWFTAEVEGIELADANGWDVGFGWAGLPALLGLAAAAIVLATTLGSAKLPDLPISWGQAFLAAGGLSALLVVLKLLIGEDGNDFVDINRGWGLFLATIAALAFAAGGYLKFQEEKSGGAGGPSL